MPGSFESWRLMIHPLIRTRPTFLLAMILTWLGAVTAPSSAQTILSQNFDNVPGMFTMQGGWTQVNNSSPLGTSTWHQGATGITAHIGEADKCISNDFLAATGEGTISAWMITPTVTLQNGQTLQFYTRTRDSFSPPDRLEVRLSLSGSSADVGTTATSVGVFTTLLTTVNPTLSMGGYPSTWTPISITLSGIAAPTSGRIAFRYFVTNGGPFGINSDIVAIDTLSLTAGQTNTCQNPLPACAGDIAPPGGNQMVNTDDLIAVITSWGVVGPPRPLGDVAPPPNGNCTVNTDDLIVVVTTWGACAGPFGACCLPTGVCSNGQTAASCAALGGVYQANNSNCAQVSCPQPNNDVCDTATPITIGSSVNENLETASADFAPTCNGVLVTQGRWHKVVGNGTNLTASICTSAGNFDGRLSVYCGPHCGALLCVAGVNANSCSGNKESVTWCAASGQTYWILVHSQAMNPGQGVYTLSVSSRGTCSNAVACGPVNDNCVNATVIGNGVTAFSTLGATTDGNPVAPGACNDSGSTQTAADIWFLYTATCTGTLRVTTCAQLGGNADYDSDIVIYTVGACPPPDAARIGCNDDDPINPCGLEPPFASTATALVAAGQQYLIRVGGFADAKVDFGTGSLNITCTP